MSLPPYHDPEVRKLDFASRAKIIYDYHVQWNKIRCESQVIPPQYRQLSAPILPSNKFKGSLLKDDDDTRSYSLRSSNRLSPKKDKCSPSDESKDLFDDNDNLNGLFHSDDVLLLEAEDKNVTSPEKPDLSNRNRTPKQEIVESKEAKSTGGRKQKLSNSDIMKRSKLFASSSNKRTQELVQNGITECKNLNRKAEEASQFELTLKELSDEERHLLSDDDELTVPELDKQHFTRKRIPPPLHGIGKRKNQSSIFVAAKKAKSNTFESIRLAEAEAEISSSTLDDASVSEINTISCPLCNKLFPQDEIEEHASNCGLVQTSELVDNKRMIKCESCDTYFEFNTDFEVHVKDCLQSLRRLRTP